MIDKQLDAIRDHVRAQNEHDFRRILAIVQAVAAIEFPTCIRDVSCIMTEECVLCGASDLDGELQHAPDCPWQAARDLLADWEKADHERE